MNFEYNYTEFMCSEIIERFRRTYSHIKSNINEIDIFIEEHLPHNAEDIPINILEQYMLMLLLLNPKLNEDIDVDIHALSTHFANVPINDLLEENNELHRKVAELETELEECREADYQTVKDVHAAADQKISDVKTSCNQAISKTLERARGEVEDVQRKCDKKVEDILKLKDKLVASTYTRMENQKLRLTERCDETLVTVKRRHARELAKVEAMYKRELTHIKAKHKRKLSAKFSIINASRSSVYITLRRSQYWVIQHIISQCATILQDIERNAQSNINQFKKEYKKNLKLLGKGTLSKKDIDKLTMDSSGICQKVKSISNMGVPQVDMSSNREAILEERYMEAIPPEAFGSNTDMYSKRTLKETISESEMNVALGATLDEINKE